jgi:hypothetical protein
MTAGSIAEMSIGVLLVGTAGWLYRRRAAEGQRYGSQSAVILLIIGALLLIHGSGMLEYRESGLLP